MLLSLFHHLRDQSDWQRADVGPVLGEVVADHGQLRHADHLGQPVAVGVPVRGGGLVGALPVGQAGFGGRLRSFPASSRKRTPTRGPSLPWSRSSCRTTRSTCPPRRRCPRSSSPEFPCARSPPSPPRRSRPASACRAESATARGGDGHGAPRPLIEPESDVRFRSRAWPEELRR